MTLLLEELALWLDRRHEQVSGAFLAHQDAALLLVVVGQRVEYDRDFTDAVSQLELDIAGNADFQGLSFRALELPKVSLAEAVACFGPALLRYVDRSANRTESV